MGSSLAKGFGAPLAVIAGNAELITKFEDLSATRVHSSPPSLAVISAAQRALAVNEKRGDGSAHSSCETRAAFPGRTASDRPVGVGRLVSRSNIEGHSGHRSGTLYRQLLSFGVRAVLRSARDMSDAALSFLITVLHTRSDIGRCMDALQHSCVLVRHQRGKRNCTFDREGSVLFA